VGLSRSILERLLDLVDYPLRDRMPCLLIYGATGMGKTRIIENFLLDNRSIQMPPAPSERDLYEEILGGMSGLSAQATGVTTLRHRIWALARQLELRMLVIDEIHSLLARLRFASDYATRLRSTLPDLQKLYTSL
jgi:ATP-dependent Lon protease